MTNVERAWAGGGGGRDEERGKGVVAENSIQKCADEHYDDAKMEKIYPNAKATE